ncbi:hypothetical protein GF352_00735 [archaeon]|nr:hypothetical protein [archaeon]
MSWFSSSPGGGEKEVLDEFNKKSDELRKNRQEEINKLIDELEDIKERNKKREGLREWRAEELMKLQKKSSESGESVA